jgi:hypothetical protein
MNKKDVPENAPANFSRRPHGAPMKYLVGPHVKVSQTLIIVSAHDTVAALAYAKG